LGMIPKKVRVLRCTMVVVEFLLLLVLAAGCRKEDPGVHLDEWEKKFYTEARKELADAGKAVECLTKRAGEAEKVLGEAGAGQRRDGLITERSNRNRLIFIGRRQVAFTRLRSCCGFRTGRRPGIPDHDMDSREIQAARARAECLKNRAEETQRLVREFEGEARKGGDAGDRTGLLEDLYNSVRWLRECCPFTAGLAIDFPKPPAARVHLPPPPPPPPPIVRVRFDPDVRISPAGEFDQKDARRRLVDLQRRIYDCYREAIEKNPSLTCRMSLAVVIHADGRVVQVEIVRDEAGHPALTECVKKRADDMLFKKSGQGATLTFGLVFELEP